MKKDPNRSFFIALSSRSGLRLAEMSLRIVHTAVPGVEEPDFGTFRHELQSLWNPVVRFVITMTFVAGSIALLVSPARNEPDLRRVLDGTHYLHAEESVRLIHQMRTRA